MSAYGQQAGESDKAYQAFTIYLNLGANHRSLAKTAELVMKSPSLIERWSSNFNWVQRASIFDGETELARMGEDREEHRKKLQSHLNQQDRFAQATVEVAIMILGRVKAGLDRVRDGNQIPRNLISAARVAAMLGDSGTSSRAEALGVEEVIKALDAQDNS